MSRVVSLSLSDIELFIRNLEYWKIVLMLVIVAGIYYYGYSKTSEIKGSITYKKTEYSQYLATAQKKYNEIEKLSKFKSNTIFLMSKIQTLNNIKDILTKRNFTYVINIKQNSLRGNRGMINIQHLATSTLKMGIYKYIPLEILVKNYIDFTNLIDTLKLLQKSNFILTGVSSVTSRNMNSIVLVGKLYVK